MIKLRGGMILGEGLRMNTSETGIVRQRLPGVLSGRIMTALFAGGSATAIATGPFLMNPETALPAILVSLGGTLGSFLFGISRTKKNTRTYSKSLFGSEGPPVNNKTIARAILGIPFAPERVLVSNVPYKNRKRLRFLDRSDTLSIKKANPDALLYQATSETENYLLYTSNGVYLEQVTRPTAISTWDSAYNALIMQHGIHMPESREDLVQEALGDNDKMTLMQIVQEELAQFKNIWK